MDLGSLFIFLAAVVSVLAVVFIVTRKRSFNEYVSRKSPRKTSHSRDVDYGDGGDSECGGGD